MKWTLILVGWGIPGVALIAGAATLASLQRPDNTRQGLSIRVPVSNPRASGESQEQPALERARLIAGPGVPSDLPGTWTCFRGAARDGISPHSLPPNPSWGDGEARILWSVDLGEGYAGPAIRNGRVYLLDYDHDRREDALRCLSLEDGREIWRFSYPVEVKRNHGMSRTVPAVTDRWVVTLGPKGHVACLDAATGEFRWGKDLVRDYGTQVPPWYAGQCPLVDGERVILAPAGEVVLMLAADIASGEIVWETPNPAGWRMTHSSITPVVAGGQKMYVYCGHRGVAGVAATDGALLWETDAWRISIATVPSPVALPGDRIFLSGGYKAGSLMLRLSRDAGEWAVESLFRLDDSVFGSTQQTPLFWNGHIYGVRPNGELVCLDPGGEVRWTSGMSHRFGLGPYLIAGGRIFVMDDHGELTVAEANPDEFRFLSRVGLLDGHDSWAPLAIAGDRLLARDLTRMVCVDLRE